VEPFKKCLLLLEINLSSSHCYNLTNEGLIEIGKGIKRLKSLRNLAVKFSCSFQITDKGLEALAKSLKGLFNLRKLNLDLSSCDEVTGKGFSSLCESIDKLSCLQYLWLSVFPPFGRITLECLKQIDEIVRKRPWLTITVNNNIRKVPKSLQL